MFARLHKVPLRHLQDFIASAESLNFGRAAEKLQRSLWGLLNSIQDLEQILEIKLFHRLPTPIRMTRDGELLVPYARAIVDSSAELVRHLATPDKML
jgi:LysR family transcriptional regulator, glycine cleavage system transcriptional activator